MPRDSIARAIRGRVAWLETGTSDASWQRTANREPATDYFFSTSTATGDDRRTVTTAPAASVAALRSPAIDDGGAAGRAGGAADDRALLAADQRTEDRAANRRAADLAGAVAGRRFAFADDRVGANRQLRAVGQHQRVEPDAEAGALLHLAAALDQRHGAERPGAGGNRGPAVHRRRRA